MNTIKQDIKKGAKYGDWILVSKLGSGGNSQVWKARNSAGIENAIKILTKNKEIAKKRFKHEVEIMQSCGVKGIVPILHANLPEPGSSEAAWYTMPIGIPLLNFLKGKSPLSKANHILGIANVLIELHSKKITHRDIKPANIICLDGMAHLGDFGLVDYPEKENITPSKEDIGPRWTLAPEIRRHKSKGDTRPADVYSLAKSLWICLAENIEGFDGQYEASKTLTIKPYFEDSFIAPLEELLEEATEHNPLNRPGIREFRDRLKSWLDLDNDFSTANSMEWKHTQKKVFPVSSPNHAEWTDIDSILSILNTIGHKTNLNHLFFPTGGGLDLEQANKSEIELNCIELICDGVSHLVKPKSLTFESFNKNEEWDYFRLDTYPLDPTPLFKGDISYGQEEVVNLSKGKYIDRKYWDIGEYRDEPLPKSAKLIVRFFGGSFIIFQKTSIFNGVYNYNGSHNNYESKEFRIQIEKLIQKFR